MNEILRRFDSIVLVTGVTGGLGGELLPRLLRRYPDHGVVALIRGTDRAQAQARLQAVLDDARVSVTQQARVAACCGDISQPRFALEESVWRELAARTVRIFHLAASVDFDLPLAESRVANVASTQHILDFAHACTQSIVEGFRLNYVSTAYVAGSRQGVLRETELRCGQSFCNAYEQSKQEAECLVARAKDRFPITIYRPSQIIGESGTGRIRKFFGYYEFLKLAARDRMPVLVANAAARPDLIPSDYVCEAMLHLSESPWAVGKTYHLTAGLAHSPNFARIFNVMYQELAACRPAERAPRQPRMFRANALAQQATRQELHRFHLSPLKLLLRTYQSYLEEERHFDCGETQAVLASAGIVLPDIEAVLRLTTRYALQVRPGLARTMSTRTMTQAQQEPMDATHIA